MHTHVLVEVRGLSEVSAVVLHSLFLRNYLNEDTVYLLSYVVLTGQQAPDLFLPPQSWLYRYVPLHLAFYVSAGDMNSRVFMLAW